MHFVAVWVSKEKMQASESVHVHACACVLAEGSNRVHANGVQGVRAGVALGGCLCRVLSKVVAFLLFLSI